MSTAKALMINTAFQYPLPPPNDNDITRDVQGWGRPDLEQLYNLRDRMVIVDESVLLHSLASASIHVLAEPATPLKATLVYADPKGDPASSVARINKLNLEVVSQSGVIYWGNYGLTAANWSAPGGMPDEVNTTENVFIQTPEAGYYTVTVTASEINLDGHVETMGKDADYALVVSGVVQGAPDREPEGGSRFAVPTPADIPEFFDAYLNGDADYNGDGVTSSADAFAYLNAIVSGSEK